MERDIADVLKAYAKTSHLAEKHFLSVLITFPVHRYTQALQRVSPKSLLERDLCTICKEAKTNTKLRWILTPQALKNHDACKLLS